MRIVEFVTTKSFLVLMVFVIGCVVASLVPSPWRDGAMLELRPSLPDGLTRHQPLFRWPEAEPADLSSLHLAFDLDDVEDDEPRDTSPLSANVTDSKSTSETDTTASTETDSLTSDDAGGRPTHRENKAQQADRRLLASLRALREKFPQKKVLLEIPCLDDDTADPHALTEPDASCEHRALDVFYASLRDRAFHKEGKTRWLQYGDSLVTGDSFTGELRRLLQQQFGDGGHGFLFIGIPLRPYQAENIRIYPTDKWYVRTVVRHSENGGRLFGLAGAEFRPMSASDFLVKSPSGTELGKDLAHFSLYYFAPPNVETGSFHLTVDGETRAVEFDVTPGSSGRYDFDIPTGDHKVYLSNFSQRLRYYGLVSETAQSGVVVDNLGMVSGRIEQLLKIDTEHWRDQLALREPTLVSFFYGVNAASSSASRLEANGDTYMERYKTVLSHVQSSTQPRSCLVLGLLTRGTHEDGKISERDSVQTLRALQRSAALNAGCAFFDTSSLVGGNEGIRRWATGTPRLLGADLAHPTPAGYHEIAHQLYANILDGFIRYMERRVARGEGTP